jgi:predicted nuclease with TOPRIM domain
MADFESLLQERTALREENEQIKGKYKKSLQELMHILKVNKSLKECLDQNTKNIESSVREHLE